MSVDSRFVWFTAGRLAPAKDLPNLLEAFRQVRREFPDAELWIAGAPPDAKFIRSSDGKASLYSVAATQREMRDSIRWLGLRRDIPALLDAADAFVLASAWEGMPLALGEAMAMEKPIVVTDAGGVRELVGGAGIVVPLKNSAALAQAMIDDHAAEQGIARRVRPQGTNANSGALRNQCCCRCVGGTVQTADRKRLTAKEKGRSIVLRPAACSSPNRRQNWNAA